MSQLSQDQYYLVLNMFAVAIGVFGVSALFFLRMSLHVAKRFCVPVTIAGLVPLVALFNYALLYRSWTSAYVLADGVAKATGAGFNQNFRYADWVITVPLNLLVLVLVMDLPSRQARIRAAVLVLQGFEMIALGYPGLLATTTTMRWAWWCAAMVPFCIIMHQLFFGLAQGFRNQEQGSRHLLGGARAIVLVVWTAYPVIYLLPLLGVTGVGAFVTTQVAYAVADMIAKGMYLSLIFMAALRKSETASVLEPALS